MSWVCIGGSRTSAQIAAITPVRHVAGGQAALDGIQSGGSPLLLCRPVQTKGRRGVGENEASHPSGVMNRRVQGVHPAERQPDQVGRFNIERVEQAGKAVGDGGERQLRQRGRRPVARHVPGYAAEAVG